MGETIYEIKPIGVIRSELASREAAPRQGYEGVPPRQLRIPEDGEIIKF